MSNVYSPYALPIGTMVQEYEIIEILGIGNFGIVYRAKNKYFSEIVALKEFLPSFLAHRPEGQQRVQPLSSETVKAFKFSRHKFLQEAKTLRELGNPVQHPNIVRVIQFIEANDTAYMVMDLEKGLSLDKILKDRGPLVEKEIISIRDALLDGLERVHAASVWHRDIKPSNILIRPDGSPVLIDFGAARKDIIGTDQSIMSIFSPAFAAPEQIHPVDDQGPWTDIYSLGATLYVAAIGNLPTNATHRIQKRKEYEPASEVANGGDYSLTFLESIDSALALLPKDRPQSISEWKEQFGTAYEPDLEKTVLQQGPEKDPEFKWPGYRSLFGAMSILMLVVIGLFVYRLIYPVPVPTPPKPPPKVEIKKGTDGGPKPDKEILLPNAHLDINSQPSEAQVFLDGELKGKTPLKTTVAKGTYKLRLELKDHYDWESTLIVKEKDEIPIQIPLQNK